MLHAVASPAVATSPAAPSGTNSEFPLLNDLMIR